MPDFADKLKDSEVPKIYICNLMTQPEETQGMNIVNHIEWVSAALGCVPDFVIANSEPIPDDIVENYKKKGAFPLYLNYHQRELIKDMGIICFEAPIMSIFENEKEGRVLRHDSQKLASAIFRLIRKIDE